MNKLFTLFTVLVFSLFLSACTSTLGRAQDNNEGKGKGTLTQAHTEGKQAAVTFEDVFSDLNSVTGCPHGYLKKEEEIIHVFVDGSITNTEVGTSWRFNGTSLNLSPCRRK